MDYQNLKYLKRYFIESFSSKNEFSRDNDDWYYFLHIPKTAGTTFRYVIYDSFDQHAIYPNYYELLFKQRSRYIGWGKFNEREQEIFPKSKKWLIGHFAYAPLRYYKDKPPVTLSFLRDPVKRVMSTIIFHQDITRRYEGLTVDEILDKHLEVEGSLQARSFGYRPQRDNLDRALKNLEKIEFVGISEQFDRSLQLCNHTFNWNLQHDKPRNVGKYKPSIFTDEQMARIEAGVEIDQIIYNHALKLFEQRCQTAGL